MIAIHAFALAIAQEASQPVADEMTTRGWVFMALAWFCILMLVYYTFSKVLGGNGK